MLFRGPKYPAYSPLPAGMMIAPPVVVTNPFHGRFRVIDPASGPYTVPFEYFPESVKLFPVTVTIP